MRKHPWLYALLILGPFGFYTAVCLQMTALVDYDLFPSFIGAVDLFAALSAGTIMGVAGAVLCPFAFSRLLAEAEESGKLSVKSVWLHACGFLAGFLVGSYSGMLIPLILFSRTGSTLGAFVSSVLAIIGFAAGGYAAGSFCFKAVSRLSA